ncbi:hypothetical protein C5167_009558, partial [Papaver somniferum]
MGRAAGRRMCPGLTLGTIKYGASTCSSSIPPQLEAPKQNLPEELDMSEAAFGNKCNDKEEFKAAFLESTKLGGGFDISDVFPSLKFLHVIGGMKPKLEKIHEKIDRIFGNVILEHKKNRITSTKNQTTDHMQEMEEDLVDVLLRLQENGELEFPITTDNIKAFILPEELDMSESFGATIRRLNDLCLIPVPYMTLTAFNQRGWIVILWTINEITYIPFEAGWRRCLGVDFGIANVQHLLVNLLYHFGWNLLGEIKPARAAFGKKSKDKEAFISLIKETTKMASGFAISDLFPSLKFIHVISGMKSKLESLHQKTDKILDNIIKEHIENRTAIKTNKDEAEEDLVDVLLQLKGNGGPEFAITPNNLKAVILDIFTAGTASSSTTVEWAMSEMLRMCPGINFGIANVELVLAQLLYHYEWKLPNGVKPEDLDMSESFGASVRRKNDLHLTPIPYKPVPT